MSKLRMVELINDTLQNKLASLVSFLSQITKGFDGIAEEIDCANLKTAMQAVAVESKQYANEISNQLQMFGVFIPEEYTDILWEKIENSVHEEASFARGGEITALCNNCEIYYSKFYDDVLREIIPFKNFKNIIAYQLYATQCAFMKIRLLNSLRFGQ